MHILLTGGGSGGHIFPNIALIHKIRSLSPNSTLSYIGEIGGMESRFIPEEHIPFFGIYAGKLRRYFSIQNFLDLFKVSLGILQASWIIWKLRPDIIFSKGGYVSLPVILAGRLFGIKIVIHESDVIPGITTKVGAKFADTICISWERTRKFFPGKSVALTGVPVREELSQGSKEAARLFLGLPEDTLPVLLVVGGSLGAGSLNTLVFSNLETLLQSYHLVHIVGKGNKAEVVLPSDTKGQYCQLEFVTENMKDILQLTDVILSRAGATALAEFAYIQKPVLMIPLPRTQSRGDQYDNAEEFLALFPGMGEMLHEEEGVTIEKVTSGLEKLRGAKVERTIESAASKICEVMGITSSQN